MELSDLFFLKGGVGWGGGEKPKSKTPTLLSGLLVLNSHSFPPPPTPSKTKQQQKKNPGRFKKNKPHFLPSQLTKGFVSLPLNKRLQGEAHFC